MPDILDANLSVINQPSPSLSATSDMPVVDATPPAGDTLTPDVPAADTPPATPPVVTDPPADPLVIPPVEVKEPQGVGKALKARDDLIVLERKRADDAVALAAQQAETIRKLTEKPPETPKPPEVAARPRREDFDNPDLYDDALIEWSGNRAAEVAQRKMEENAAATRTKAEADTLAETERTARETADTELAATQTKFQQRRAAALQQWPDYEAVAESPDVQITSNMAYTIMQMENGPAIAYHLGKTPTEAARIAALPGPMQIAEIGRLSALAAPAKAPVTRPNPPAPINALGPNNGAQSPRLEDMPTESYVEARLKEIRASSTRH